jgi:hypothetical protein
MTLTIFYSLSYISFFTAIYIGGLAISALYDNTVEPTHFSVALPLFIPACLFLALPSYSLIRATRIYAATGPQAGTGE